MSNSPKFHTDGHPAPGELVKVHGFLNTWSDELGIEELPSPKAANAWLVAAGLLESRTKLRQADLEHITDFRATLRRYLLAPEAAAAMEATVQAIDFQIAVTNDSATLLPRSSEPWQQVVGQLIAIMFCSMQDGTWQRFKCCELPTCGWAFYDSSRSRTKRWCSMRTCGSRHKARTYYQRNKN